MPKICHMSSFDDALRRQQAQRDATYATEQSFSLQRRHMAEAAVPTITRLLQEFSIGLSRRGVEPERIELLSRRGILRLPRYSPAGYELMAKRTWDKSGRQINPRPRVLSLVTSEGRLWCHGMSGQEGFVSITVENLLNKIYLDGDTYLAYGANGEPQTYRHGDPPSAGPLEELLAQAALRLIDRSSR